MSLCQNTQDLRLCTLWNTLFPGHKTQVSVCAKSKESKRVSNSVTWKEQLNFRREPPLFVQFHYAPFLWHEICNAYTSNKYIIQTKSSPPLAPLGSMHLWPASHYFHRSFSAKLQCYTIFNSRHVMLIIFGSAYTAVQLWGSITVPCV